MKTHSLIAALTLLALACGGDGDGGTGPQRVSVASVTVTPALDTVIPGQVVQLTASARDASGGSIQGRETTWTSSSNSIATVSPAGTVTGVSEGAVTITASVDGVAGASQLTVRFPFPNAAGTYTVSGSFDNDPTTFSGTVTVVQNSRLAGELSGNAIVTVISSNGSLNTLTALGNASVTEAGAVSFTVGLPSIGATWEFTGQLAGNTITGHHILRGSTTLFPGSWQAIRTGPLAVFSKTSH